MLEEGIIQSSPELDHGFWKRKQYLDFPISFSKNGSRNLAGIYTWSPELNQSSVASTQEEAHTLLHFFSCFWILMFSIARIPKFTVWFIDSFSGDII